MRAANQAITHATSSIERYETLHQLGHGSSSVVYLVRRKQDNQLFAMKTIDKTSTLASDAAISRLITERAVLIQAAESRSRFIVRLIDAFETDEKLCFVTEFAQHGDLSNVLDKIRGRGLSENTARQLFSEMVLGLEETHRMGYLYRDFALGNLLLNSHGHIKLADFGLAKKLDIELLGSSVSSGSEGDLADDDEAFSLVGRTNSFVGTRRYMSPEHLNRWKQGYGAPSDIWAMGVSLYVMLTGMYPFGNFASPKDTNSVFEAIQSTDVSYPTGMSEDAKDLLHKLLMKEEQDRLDIAAIKAHPWMCKVDWETIQYNAEHNVLQSSVLEELIGTSNAPEEDEGMTLEGSFLTNSTENGSRRSSRASSDSFEYKRIEKGKHDLVGFRYVNPLNLID